MPRTASVILALLLGGFIACSETRDPGVATGPLVEVYRSPTCGCCASWADHLAQSGFRVRTIETEDLAALKRQYGVPMDSQACHTAIVEGYVIEGHVPASDVERLLRDAPEIRGLVAPGMPLGAPGMEGRIQEPYTVYAFDDEGARSVFARH